MTTNLDEEELVLDTKTLIFPPFTVKVAGSTSYGWFIPPILKKEEASVKDSIASGLPSREQNVGAKASGSGGQLELSMLGGPKVYTPMGGDIKDVKKMAFVPQKIE